MGISLGAIAEGAYEGIAPFVDAKLKERMARNLQTLSFQQDMEREKFDADQKGRIAEHLARLAQDFEMQRDEAERSFRSEEGEKERKWRSNEASKERVFGQEG